MGERAARRAGALAWGSWAKAPSWLAGAAAALLLTLPAWVPAVRPDFNLWQVDDGTLHLHRSLFLAQLVRDGNWFPRWMPQEYGGYGYPTLNFYAPGLYYLTLALAFLTPGGLYGGLYSGMQAVTSLAALVVILGTYLLAWRLWRHGPAALVAAASVAYAPYVLQGNIFISGSMTHVLGLACMVLLLGASVGLWQQVTEGRSVVAWWWFLAGATAAVFLAHNAVAAVSAVVVALWVGCLLLWRPSVRAFVSVASAAIAGVLAVAFFWLPALTETRLVQIENNQHGNLNYHDHFLRWPGFHREDVWGLQARGPWTVGTPIDLHLVYPHSLYGPVRLGLWQGMTWVGALVVLFVFAATTWRRRPGGRLVARDRRRLSVLAIGFGLALALASYSQTFDWALPWWDRIAALRSIQLPSRLLAPAIFGLAIAVGGSVALCVHATRVGWALALAATLGLAVAGLGDRPVPLQSGVSRDVAASSIADVRLHPGYTDSMDEFLPRTQQLTTWHENEARGFWLYERMFPEAEWVGGRVMPWQGSTAVKRVAGQALWTTAWTSAGPSGATLAFHQLAFSGWRAWIDGRPVPLRPAPAIESEAIAPGFILVDVPPGDHEVSIRFGPDGPRLAGAALSLLTLLGVSWWLVVKGRRAAGPQRRWLFYATGAGLAAAIAIAAVRTLLPLWPPGAV